MKESTHCTSLVFNGRWLVGEGGSQADVTNRIIIRWMKWKEVSGVMCDKRMPVQ